MATTDNLDIELLSTNPLQLDPIVNEAFTTIDACLAGTSTYDFTDDANYTLTDEYFTAYLTLTDGSTNLTTGRDVVYPSAFPIQVVKNLTAQTITVKVTGQTGVAIAAGSTVMVYADGTDVVEIPASGSALTNPMTTLGDLILGGASGAAGRLAIGANGYVLTSNGTTAAWAASPGDRKTVSVVTSSSGVANFNWALGDYFTLALSENVTSITFSNLPGSGNGTTFMIRITQGAGPYTVAWPASFRWEGGVAGAVSTGNGDVDVLAITTFDNGTTWIPTLLNAAAAP